MAGAAPSGAPACTIELALVVPEFTTPYMYAATVALKVKRFEMDKKFTSERFVSLGALRWHVGQAIEHMNGGVAQRMLAAGVRNNEAQRINASFCNAHRESGSCTSTEG